jgi:predicted  nucleic acid-binding Zn-ribbon protein
MWELQNVEVEMVQLRREWSRIKDLISKDNYGDHEDIQAGIEVAREQWQKIKEDFNVTVTEIEKIGRKLEQLNHQLYDQGGQSKELISLQQNIQQLEKRKLSLDEKQLGYIEELDQLEKRIANETCRLHRMEDQRRSRLNRLRQRLEEVRQDYSRLKERRQELREIIPSHMMAVYNALVEQKKRPMALLKGDNCDGCGIAQTVLNVNALRKSGQYTRCSNCGRILIMESAAMKE